MHCEHWLSLKALQNHLIQTVKGNHEQCFPLLQLTNTYKIHQANAKLCLTSQKNVDVWWKKESRRYMTYKLNKLQETILLLLHRMKWRKDQRRRGRWLKDQDRWEWDPLCVTKKTVGLKIMMDIHKVIKHVAQPYCGLYRCKGLRNRLLDLFYLYLNRTMTWSN